MAWVDIVAYALDYQLGNTGIVYFKLAGESSSRSTGGISPEIFNAISNVLKTGPTVYETDQHVFRATPPHAAALAPTIESFVEQDFDSAKNI